MGESSGVRGVVMFLMDLLLLKLLELFGVLRLLNIVIWM